MDKRRKLSNRFERRYPCSVCRKNCLNNKALLCSMCDKWLHLDCIQVEVCVRSCQSWLERNDYLCPQCCFVPESDKFDCHHSLLRLMESLNNGTTGDLIKTAEREKRLLETYVIKCPNITDSVQNFPEDKFSVTLLSECKNKYTIEKNLKPYKIENDGNCFYRSVSLGLFGTQYEHVYLRLLTALEVLNNEDFYINLVRKDSNEIFDCRFVLPTFASFVNSLVTLGEYADIVHFYALSAVIGKPIQSVYPLLLEDNYLTEIYNRKVIGKGVDDHNNPEFAIMWTMADNSGRVAGVFFPNHFVPLLNENQLAAASTTLLPRKNNAKIEETHSKVTLVKSLTYDGNEEEMDSRMNLTISFEKKQKKSNKVMTLHNNKDGKHLRLNLPIDPIFRCEFISAGGLKFELKPFLNSRTTPCLLRIRGEDRSDKKYSLDLKCNYRNHQYDVELVSCDIAYGCTVQVNASVLSTSLTKSIHSKGKIILASQQTLIIKSQIRCPSVCLHCNGNVRLLPEANIETTNLELIGATVYVDSLIKYDRKEQILSKLRIVVVGDLHISRDAVFGGMVEHGKTVNFLSRLEIIIKGDLCNHGQIKANDVIHLVCANIRSCQVCKTDTSQNYLKALTETSKVLQSSVDKEINTSKPSQSAMIAVRQGDIGYLHKLLHSGIDPNAPLYQNGRSLTDEATLIRRKTFNTQNSSPSKQRETADNAYKLLDAWNKRSGIIVSESLVCNVSGNIDALNQLSCKHLNLKVNGNVTVEKKSICTIGEISGNVCGAFQIHGTMKIRTFKKFEAGFILLKHNVVLIVGEGGEIRVTHSFKNEGQFVHLKNILTITTGEFETSIGSRIESNSHLCLHIREDSKYLLGTIEANIIAFTFSAKCTNSGFLSATELCQLTFVHEENKFSQLENSSSIKVLKGPIVMKSVGYKNSSYDLINRGNVSTFGVEAERASIKICQSSSFDVYPNMRKERSNCIDVRALNDVNIEKSAKINMHVNDTTTSINLICLGHLFQYGCIDIVQTSCTKHQLNIHAGKFIYKGSIKNAQQLNLNIQQQMHSYITLTAEVGITITGNGALYNESGSYLHCPNGYINIIGSALVVNKKGARIKGKGVRVETMQCQNYIDEPDPLDFRNKGLVESDDVIIICADNIANTGCIVCTTLSCKVFGSMYALNQLSCEYLRLVVNGNMTVEKRSKCTIGEISGKVCGAMQIHGTIKIRTFKQFEVGSFLLKQNVGLIDGAGRDTEGNVGLILEEGGDIDVIHLFNNEGYLYHEHNSLTITTGELKTSMDSKIESKGQLHVHIREDSKYLLGTIEANVIDFLFSAKCKNSGFLCATRLCQFTFVHDENKCSQLENSSSIKVHKGHIVINSNMFKKSSDDFINRGNVSTLGIEAERASIKICQNSLFDVYPNIREERSNCIDVRALNINIEKSATINMHVNDTTTSINLICLGHLFQYGCINILPTSCITHQLNIHTMRYIYDGSIVNGQKLNLKIEQHMHSSEYMTAEAGITIEGEGALCNESGSYLHCPNGYINVIGSALVVNKRKARIKGKGVRVITRQCQIAIKDPEPLDFINEGVVESDDKITIHAGNISNTGRFQSLKKSFGVELCWFAKQKSVVACGEILSSGWLRLLILKANNFKCAFKGGKSLGNDSVDRNDTIYMPDGDFSIECSEGDVLIESNVLQGDTKSKLTISCAKTCAIKSIVNINDLQLYIKSNEKITDENASKTNSKMTFRVDGGKIELLTLKAFVQEKPFLVEAAATEDSFICRQLLQTDGCLEVKGTLEFSFCCTVSAFCILFDKNSRCLITGMQSPNKESCRFVSQRNITHSGRIETLNRDLTVVLVNLSGDINIKGTIIASSLIMSSKEHITLCSGCILTAVGALVVKTKKLTTEKDSYCHVGSGNEDDNLLIQCGDEINLEGSLYCVSKDVCSIECQNMLLFKKSFRAEFVVDTIKFISKKLIKMEECLIEVHEGSLVFSNANENDKEVHGDIKIFGSTLTRNRNVNVQMTNNFLEIEGNNVYLERSSLSCIDSITIYAATNVLLDEKCSMTNNGSIQMQATNIKIEGDLLDFENLSLESDKSISVCQSAKIQKGREIKLSTSTAEIFGHIKTLEKLKIDVESALVHAKISHCKNIHVEVAYALINSGELHANEMFIKSPIFINSPRSLSQSERHQSAALVIGGEGTDKIKIEGILLVKIGCCVTGTSIIFESVMQFAFESRTSTIPDKDVLSRWKQTSESSLLKLRNAQCSTDVQKLYQIATELPKVICNLSASSNMCNDIVEMTKNIYENGIEAFDINQVTSVFESAHTQYSDINSLRDGVKRYIRQKNKMIKKKKDKIKHAVSDILDKVKASFQDEQDVKVGIKTRTFTHQSDDCEQKSHTSIQYSFAQNGLCAINGQLSAQDDIVISGADLAIKARGLKAIKGMISLQGRDVDAKQLDAFAIKVTGEDSCLSDVNVKEDLTVKSKSGNISNVSSGGKVSVECSDSVNIEQIRAREGNFKAGNVSLLNKEGKAKHEFQKLLIESKQLSDIDGLLDTTGAYKDMHVADELGLIVEDQDVIIANRKKCDFNVHVKAASLKIKNDVSAKQFVAETTNGEISVSDNVKIKGDSIRLKAKTDLTLQDRTKLEANSGSISLVAGNDICSGASINSKESIEIKAGGDFKSKPYTYTTRNVTKKSSFFGLCSETTVTETTHVEKPKIRGKNIYIEALGKAEIEATDMWSANKSHIKAKGDVVITDRVTETKTSSTKSFLGIHVRSKNETVESSHGSQISTDGDLHVESENSDIYWIGSSLKSKGNTTEKAKKGNIYHKKQILKHTKSSKGLFFDSKITKPTMSYRNSSNRSQSTSNDNVDIGGSYTIKTNSYEASADITVGENMNVTAKNFEMKGTKLRSEDENFELSCGLDMARAVANINYSNSHETKYQKASLRVGNGLLLNNVNSVTLTDVLADVGKIEGNVDKMTIITNPDEKSEFGVNIGAGFDLVTKVPDASFGVSYNNVVKVNQSSEITIRGGSENLRVESLNLTGSTISFHGNVDKFAKNVVSNDVHETQTSFSLGLSVGISSSSVPKSRVSGQADIKRGKYLSCISSNSGIIDKSISSKVITDKNKRRRSELKFGVKFNFEELNLKQSFESIGSELCKLVGKTCPSELCKIIGSKLELQDSFVKDLADIVKKGIRLDDISSLIMNNIDKMLVADLKEPVLGLLNGNPQKIVQWICSLINADNSRILSVMAEFLSNNKGEDETNIEELLLLILRYGIPYIKGFKNVQKLCVVEANLFEELSVLFTCSSARSMALRLIQFLNLNGTKPNCGALEFLGAFMKDKCQFTSTTETSETLTKVIESKTWLDRRVFLLELLGKKFELPDIWIKALKNLLKQKDTTTIIAIIAEEAKVNKYILMVLLKAVLERKQTGQIIRNLAKEAGISDNAFQLIETLVRQTTTGSVKSAKKFLSDLIDWDKVLTA